MMTNMTHLLTLTPRLGARGSYYSLVKSRSVPEGISQWEFQYPFQVPIFLFKYIEYTPHKTRNSRISWSPPMRATLCVMDGRTRSSTCMCTPSRMALSSTRSLSSENLWFKSHVPNHTSVRYTGFKEVIKVVALPDKPSVVALIDVDKVLEKPSLFKLPRSRETWWISCNRSSSRASPSGMALAQRTAGTVFMPQLPVEWRCST